EQGQTVGIIGPNGAGKSTVLKLISRIIEPTSGEVEVNGRIGALLELGAGFHPDLTGRENIYLNGSILGLRRSEIEQKMDEIIAFAELERFIDIPVKHYSSGMYVRLGFSVAVHTRPEILLVDEVLAVGDKSFQQKCTEEIDKLRRGKCTVLFVSHDLQAVQNVCTEAIWLDEGVVQEAGTPNGVIASYTGDVAKRLEARLDRRNAIDSSLSQPAGLLIRNVEMVGEDDSPRWTFQSGEPVKIQILYEATQKVEEPVFSILVHRSDGLYVSSTNTYNIDPLDLGPVEGQGKLTVSIDHLDLCAGDYFLSAGAYYAPDPPSWSTEAHFLEKALQFRIISDGKHGVIALPASWSHSADG
ncbi:MAG: ABC transporter ATP-binding protein, partial [Anaerolineae bacterium]